tara:strand:+ start:1191 stop:1772 length:582 start_codon:yes stop_codon:yes gene_type:complete
MIYVYVTFVLLLFLLSFYYYFNKFRNSFEIKYNFLSKNDFERLKVLLKEYKLLNDPRTNERKSICIMDKTIVDLIYKYFRYAENPPSYPIEYRKYDTGSQGMHMHKDIDLFDNKNYYEAVLTLENTSDSKFLYNDKSIWLPPNTLVLVKPNTVIHGVSPVTKGYRTILKFIICSKCSGLENKNFFIEANNCPF